MTQKNKWIVGILVTFSIITLTGKITANTQIALRVAVWDLTENNPMHQRAEIWIRGIGSKFLKDSPFLAGEYTPGSRYKAFFYPESRDGNEIIFYFAVTEDMNPNGSVQHSLWISFDDEEIKLYGTPIKAANEESELIFKR